MKRGADGPSQALRAPTSAVRPAPRASSSSPGPPTRRPRVAGRGAGDDRLVLGDRAAARAARPSRSTRGGAAAARAGAAALDLGVAAASTNTSWKRSSALYGRRWRARSQRRDEGVVVAAQRGRRSSRPSRGTASSVASPCTRGEQRERLVGVADGQRRRPACSAAGAISTRPSSARRRSASRTGVRLRPSQAHSSSSCSASPGRERAVHDRLAQLVVGGVPQEVPVDRVPLLGNWHLRCQ